MEILFKREKSNLKNEMCNKNYEMRKNKILETKSGIIIIHLNHKKKLTKLEVMLKFILLCIGIIFLFESSIYLFFPQKTKEAIKKYGSVDSGRSLPFAELTKTLEEKNKKEEK